MTKGEIILLVVTILIAVFGLCKWAAPKIMLWLLKRKLARMVSAPYSPLAPKNIEKIKDQIAEVQQNGFIAAPKHRIRNNRKATPGRFHQIVWGEDGSHKRIIQVR